MPKQIDRRWLWTAAAVGFVGCILMVTVSPTGWRLRSPRPFDPCLICGDRGTADAALNLLLFIPLGVFLARGWGRGWIVTLVPLAVSLSIELAQTVLPGRYPTVGDLVTNGLGGALGVVLAAPGGPLDRLAYRFIRGRALWWSLASAVGVLSSSTVLLIPVLLEPPYVLELAPDHVQDGSSRGSIEEVRVLGQVLGPSQTRSNEVMRTAVRRGSPLEIDMIAGEQAPSTTTVFAVFDSDGREQLDLEMGAGQFELRYLTFGRRLHLDRVRAHYPGSAAEVTPGEGYTITIERVGRVSCIRVEGARACPTSPDAGSLAAFFLPFGQDSARMMRAVSIITLLMLGVLVGASALRAHLAWAAGGGLAAVYLILSGLPVHSSADPLVLLALALGVAAGWLAGRAVRGRWGAGLAQG